MVSSAPRACARDGRRPEKEYGISEYIRSVRVLPRVVQRDVRCRRRRGCIASLAASKAHNGRIFTRRWYRFARWVCRHHHAVHLHDSPRLLHTSNRMAAVLVADLDAFGRAIPRFCLRLGDWFFSRLLCFLLETSKIGRLTNRSRPHGMASSAPRACARDVVPDYLRDQLKLRLAIGAMIAALVWVLYVVRVAFGVGPMHDDEGDQAPALHYLVGALAVTGMVAHFVFDGGL